jgi:3-hydroxyacyl-CoA dehydrogenase
VLDFLEDYGQRILGKVTVMAKDTPAFVANRIGVFGIMDVFHLVTDMGLTVEEVDRLTGPVIGHPKSATFRTADVVGLDTLVKVAQGVKDNCPHDERNSLFSIPEYLQKMVEKNMLGSKTGKGFFFKDRNSPKGEILSLDLKTLEYKPQVKPKFATLDAAKKVDDLRERLKLVYNGTDKAGEFYRRSFQAMFAYVSHRIPEISDELFKIDDGMRAGFGWEAGPFETWDAIGVKAALDAMSAAGVKVSPWVNEMIAAGHSSFYKVRVRQAAVLRCRQQELQACTACGRPDRPQRPAGKQRGVEEQRRHRASPGRRHPERELEQQDEHHRCGGDPGPQQGHRPRRAGLQGPGGLQRRRQLQRGRQRGHDLHDGRGAGVRRPGDGRAHLPEHHDAHALQQHPRGGGPAPAVPGRRHRALPARGQGGGARRDLHGPGGVRRGRDPRRRRHQGVRPAPRRRTEGGRHPHQRHARALPHHRPGQGGHQRHEAFALGYLRRGQDEVIVSRAHQLAYAKACALELWNKGYTKPAPRKDIKVLGQEGLGIVYVGANSMLSGNYISQHDALISEKLGYVLCGGDLSEATEVSEQYLLDLERKAFVELCMQRKTLERLQSIITSGKVLRN